MSEKNELIAVKDISKVDAVKIRSNLKRLKTEIEVAYVEVAKLLWSAAHDTVGGETLFRAWGFVSFEDYAQTELGMKRGKAYYLAQIWAELHVTAQLPENQIKRIPWSSAKELAPLAKAGGLTPANAEDWIKKSKTMAVHQLAEEAKAAKRAIISGTNVPVEIVHRITLGLYADQFDNYERAMSTAEQLAQSKKPGHLLDVICTEFNAQYAGKRVSRGKAMKRYIAMIERAFSIRIIALDPADDTVLAGKDMVKELGVE